MAITLPFEMAPYLVRGEPVNPATEKLIIEFERNFRVTLPADYKEFLLTANGGIPARRRFSGPDGSTCGLEKFFYLGMPEADPKPPSIEGWDFGNLWAETRVRQEVLGEGCIPIGRNGLDDIVFLDCQCWDSPPSVRVLFGDSRTVGPVAKGFQDFLLLLR